jgi:hypothetical protein
LLKLLHLGAVSEFDLFLVDYSLSVTYGRIPLFLSAWHEGCITANVIARTALAKRVLRLVMAVTA